MKTISPDCSGVTVEERVSGRKWEIEAFAPKGKRFVATDTHMLVESLFDGTGGRTQARKDMSARISMGLIDCDDAACDYCSEAE